jgi:ribose-phosphate pyrophosphokinase
MKESTVIFNMFDSCSYYQEIGSSLGYVAGELIVHEFPDQETLVTVKTPVKNKNVIIMLSLDKPNIKILPLIFAVKTMREMGAKGIGLITPYLAYMRQDKVFHEGEGISAKYFAALISELFDWMMTIDPHLHRFQALGDVFSIPSYLLHATQPIADWIKANVDNPVLIGPDKESSQWVAEIARSENLPYLIVEKTRFGDKKVESTIPQIQEFKKHSIVLVDDIISSGVTMLETIKHIQAFGIKSIYCIGVHAIFANQSDKTLIKSGIKELVTCNTISHPTNRIDVSKLIIEALSQYPTKQ